jgi:hypothetical protein
MRYMGDALCLDGASFFHYILEPAAKLIKEQFGIMWIVKPCKSSRRVLMNRGDPRLGINRKSRKWLFKTFLTPLFSDCT